MVRDSREKKCMPCVVARIYIVGSLVVLERGVRVRRNCNIFNNAMENVLKGLPDKISCPDIIPQYLDVLSGEIEKNLYKINTDFSLFRQIRAIQIFLYFAR
jgi:hypothetical protein